MGEGRIVRILSVQFLQTGSPPPMRDRAVRKPGRLMVGGASNRDNKEGRPLLGALRLPGLRQEVGLPAPLRNLQVEGSNPSPASSILHLLNPNIWDSIEVEACLMKSSNCLR